MIAAECSRLLQTGEDWMGKDGRYSARITTTVSRVDKAELERIADKQGVTTAWLVRRAIERLIEQVNGGAMLPLDFGADNAKR